MILVNLMPFIFYNTFYKLWTLHIIETLLTVKNISRSSSLCITVGTRLRVSVAPIVPVAAREAARPFLAARMAVALRGLRVGFLFVSACPSAAPLVTPVLQTFAIGRASVIHALYCVVVVGLSYYGPSPSPIRPLSLLLVHIVLRMTHYSVIFQLIVTNHSTNQSVHST